MLQTLLVNLKLHFREKAQLFWLFAFPIILATMFNGMFGNIAESYALHTVDVVVVNNDDWRASPGAQMLVDGISSDTGATGADGDHVPGAVTSTANLGVTVERIGPWFGAMRFRYFGPRPLIEVPCALWWFGRRCLLNRGSVA